MTICVAIAPFGVFLWKEVLAFPGSFKQTNHVFHGKLSGCHMDDEPTNILKHTSMHVFIGNRFHVLGSGDFLEGKNTTHWEKKSGNARE